MIALSLFSGAGGMDVGMKDAGFNILAASEIDPHACKTLANNHPEVTVFEGDVSERIEELTRFKDLDLVYGGPPCQGFSVAGKMDPTDPRSKLVFTFCDIVKANLPKAFVMENVKSLGTLSKFSKIRRQLVEEFESVGYTVSLCILNAKDFGVPQTRERVFFIGFRDQKIHLNSEHFKPFYRDAVTLRDAIFDLGRPGSLRNPHITKAKVTLALNPVLRRSPYAGMLFNGQGRPLNPDSWSSTLPASMGGNRTPVIDDEQLYNNQAGWVELYHNDLIAGRRESAYGTAPSRLRRLTLSEAAILQTFPGDYKFSGPQSRVFSQIGNAVPCRLAEVVGSVVRLGLNEKLVSVTVGKNGQAEFPLSWVNAV